MADRLLGILRHQALKLTLGLFVLKMSGLRPRKHRREFRPGIGRGHIDDPDRFYSWFWRFDSEQSRRLAILDTAPELPLGRNDEVLIERIGMDLDLHPFAATGNHRKDRIAGRHHEHVVLQLRGMLLRRRPPPRTATAA